MKDGYLMRVSLALCSYLGLVSLAGCTMDNPAYQRDGGSTHPREVGAPGDAPPGFDGPPLVVEGGQPPSDVSRPPDAGIGPDSVPWQCTKASDCSDNLDCTVDSCGPKKTCEHELVPGTCLIGGSCHAPGDLNPANECEACGSTQSTSAWSPVKNGTPCAADPSPCTSDVCKAGTCEHPLQNNACLIAGVCYQTGDSNPDSDCETCNPPVSGTQWSSTPATCYRDLDGDGFGNQAVVTTACTCSPGWTSDTDFDCDDSRADVNPAQQTYFKDPYPTPSGKPSWDYDCDGKEEQQYFIPGACVKPGSSCVHVPGWSGFNIPACGVAKPYITGCTQSGPGECNPVLADVRQACR
jgi:hypothetical protein